MLPLKTMSSLLSYVYQLPHFHQSLSLRLPPFTCLLRTILFPTTVSLLNSPSSVSSTHDERQAFHSSELENSKLNFEEEKEKPSVKDGHRVDRAGDQIMKEKSECVSNDGSTEAFSSAMKALSVDNGVKNAPIGTTVKIETAPKSPQRIKVLKTWIDELGCFNS